MNSEKFRPKKPNLSTHFIFTSTSLFKAIKLLFTSLCADLPYSYSSSQPHSQKDRVHHSLLCITAASHMFFMVALDVQHANCV